MLNAACTRLRLSVSGRVGKARNPGGLGDSTGLDKTRLSSEFSLL